MTKEALLHQLELCDIKAHIKAGISIVSPLCDLDIASGHAAELLIKTIMEKLERFCDEEKKKTD